MATMPFCNAGWLEIPSFDNQKFISIELSTTQIDQNTTKQQKQNEEIP